MHDALSTFNELIMKTRLNRLASSFALLTAAMLGIALPATAQNAPPDLLSYQGYLTDANGDPLAMAAPANYPVTFRIFGAPTGGTALWSEAQTVTVDKGYFSVVLGEGTQVGTNFHGPLSSILTNNSAADRYIETTVTISGSPTLLLPRLRLLPSAYAFLATRALNVADSALSANVALRSGGNTFSGTQRFNDPVGIGIAPSTNSLHVNGPIRSESSIRSLGNNTVVNPGNQNANVQLSWLSNIPRIRVAGSGAGSANGFDIQTASDRSLLRVADDGTVTAGAFVGSGAGLTNLARPSGLDGADGNPVNAVFVDANGQVGIGTTTPSGQLEIEVATNNVDARPLVITANSRVTHLLGVDTSGYGYVQVRDNTGNILVSLDRRGSWINEGNLGIGTTTPGFPLTFPNSVGDKISLWGQSGNHIGFGVQSGLLQIHTHASTGDIAFGYGTSGAMTETMRIKGTGNVGIGTANPANRLSVAGTADISGSLAVGTLMSVGGAGINGSYPLNVLGNTHINGGLYVAFGGTSYKLERGGVPPAGNYAYWNSDARLKRDVMQLPAALETVRRLRGVTWHWNALGIQQFTNKVEQNFRSTSGRPEDDQKVWAEKRKEIVERESKLHYGFIAQEVEKVLPDWVTTNETGFKQINMDRLSAVLVEAIKEQQTEIDTLKERLTALEAKDKARSDKFAALESLVREKLEGVKQAGPSPFRGGGERASDQSGSGHASGLRIDRAAKD